MAGASSSTLGLRIVDTAILLLLGVALIRCVLVFVFSSESERIHIPDTSAQPAATPVSEAPETATSIHSVGRPKEILGNPALFHTFPILRNRFIDTKRASDFVLYSPFFRAHELTPAQIEQIMDVLSNREALWVDLQARRSDEEMGYDDDIEERMNREADLHRDRSLHNILGPLALEQFKAYRASLHTRTLTVGLRAIIATTYDGRHPLRASQFEDLMKASQVTRVFGGRFDPLQPADYNAMESKMRGILLPEQIEDFYLIFDYRKLENAETAARSGIR